MGVGEADEIYYLNSQYFSLFSSFLRACLKASASAPILDCIAENNDLSIMNLFYSELTCVLFVAFKNVERRNLLATARDLKKTMLLGTALRSWQTELTTRMESYALKSRGEQKMKFSTGA